MAKESVKVWWKDHIVQVISVSFTLITLVFSMGAFYSRFNALEKNIDLKLDNQEKVVRIVTTQQGSRIQNLENMVIMNMNNVDDGVRNVKAEIIKNRRESQSNRLSQTVELKKSGKVLYDTVIKVTREIRDTTNNRTENNEK